MNDEQKAALREYVASLGLDYAAEFVPASRAVCLANDDKSPGINWHIAIKRGRLSLETPYYQGAGHLPNYSHQFARLQVYDDAVREACETGKSRLIKAKNGYDAAQADRHVAKRETIPAPDVLDVLYSLVMDASALDADGFESWASDYGYDTDSRKAEQTYRACVDIGLKLRAMVGDDGLRKLQEFFQDY